MLVIICHLIFILYAVNARFKPDWDEFDKRPLPQWYDVAKISIFVHWGLYSVPAYKSEWFWKFWDNGDEDVLNFAINNNFSNYENFVRNFTGELFEPDEWADLFSKAGAQYVVLTAKHHDGFALFQSSGEPLWNSVESGPRKDIVDLLSKSVRNYSMKFGVYYSLMEWNNKNYPKDNLNSIRKEYVDNVLIPDIQQLILDYKPSVLWADGDWEGQSDSWKSKEILAWIFNESPVKDEIVVNDRWGTNVRNKHGDFFNGNDRLNPKHLLFHKWENALSLDRKSWGFRSDLSDILSIEELLEAVVSTVSCGGNILINVGPTKEGIIVPIFQKLLTRLGIWLEINGEAIYDTSPWYHQNDILNPNVWYTCKKLTYNPWRTSHVPSVNDKIIAIYAIFLKWPVDDLLKVKDLGYYLKITKCTIRMLVTAGNYTVNGLLLDYIISTNNVVIINLPRISSDMFLGAWVLKISP